MKPKLAAWPAQFSLGTGVFLLTAFGVLFVMPYILTIAHFALWEVLGDGASQWVSIVFTSLFVLVFMGKGVFLNAGLYLAVSGVGLLLAGWLWWRGPHRYWLKGWAALTALAIVAFPIVFRYQPALNAAPGFRLINATQPSLVDGVVKSAQRTLEISPCMYELLGWDAANQLYYSSVCGEARQLWRFAPATMAASEAVAAIPENLHRIELTHEATLELVRADNIRPKNVEAMAREMHLETNGLVSSDGRWTALITQATYGPYDVVIVTAGD